MKKTIHYVFHSRLTYMKIYYLAISNCNPYFTCLHVYCWVYLYALRFVILVRNKIRICICFICWRLSYGQGVTFTQWTRKRSQLHRPRKGIVKKTRWNKNPWNFWKMRQLIVRRLLKKVNDSLTKHDFTLLVQSVALKGKVMLLKKKSKDNERKLRGGSQDSSSELID